MMVVDDHHLFALLADQADPSLQADLSSSGVFTTSAWYYRLARAAHDTRFLGALSRQIEALDPDGRQLVLELLDELPTTVGILSPRVLVPVMAKLTGVQLNLLRRRRWALRSSSMPRCVSSLHPSRWSPHASTSASSWS